jgi:hypothetical protein
MATREQVDELLQKMSEQRAELISIALSLSPEEALKVPVDAEGEEQWTAHEQLAHLCEMERSYDAWIRAALREDVPDLAKIPWQQVDIPIEEANNHPREELVRKLELERAYTVGLIDGIALDHFERTARSPMFGELTVMQWLRSFYRHDRQHTAQIAGRKSDYQPNFKNKEPNQRKARLELVERRKGQGAQ